MATGSRQPFRTSDANRPYQGAVPVTPTDDPSLSFPTTRGVYLGTAGSLAVQMPDTGGIVVVFPNLPIGFVPIQCFKVMFTGTTASNILALY